MRDLEDASTRRILKEAKAVRRKEQRMRYGTKSHAKKDGGFREEFSEDHITGRDRRAIIRAESIKTIEREGNTNGTGERRNT